MMRTQGKLAFLLDLAREVEKFIGRFPNAKSIRTSNGSFVRFCTVLSLAWTGMRDPRSSI